MYENTAMIAMPGEPQLYYRHAKGENLFVVGPESNHYKAMWIRRQIDMFTGLGWAFIVLDMSHLGKMGTPHIIGERWTNIERNFVRHTKLPVMVRIPRFRDLLETLDDINLLKFETDFPHTVVVHLGDMRTLAQNEKEALFGALLKVSSYNDGLWLITERFQSFPMEHMDLFHTQVVIGHDEPDIALPVWQNMYHLKGCDVTQLEETEAYFLFRGRSEGAKRLLISDLYSLH